MLQLFLLLSTLITLSNAIPSYKREETVTGAGNVLNLTGIADDEKNGRFGYSTQLTVNEKPYDLLVDTGHNLTWIAHDLCARCKYQNMTTINLPLPNECMRDLKRDIDYGVGIQDHISGCFVNVTLELGGKKIDNYPVLAVTSMTDHAVNIIPRNKYSGNLGLAGFREASESETSSVLNTMLDVGQLTSKEFGLYMSYNNSDNGKMNLGDATTIPEVDQGKIAVVPAADLEKQHFDIQVDKLTIDGTVLLSNFIARLDSSMTDMYYPSTMDEKVRSKLNPKSNKNGLEPIKCGDNKPFTLTIGGQEFEVKPKDIPLGVAGTDCLSNVRSQYMYNGTNAYEQQLWYFGTAFFDVAYPSFNLETGEVKLYGLKA